MTSDKQTAANQANATHSTGPRTEEGKANSRLNGLKHGLTGIMRLLPDEDQAEYAAHCEGIVDSFRPQGALELRLAQSIADDYWRIDRIRRIEQTMFNSAYFKTSYGDTDYRLEDFELHVAVDQGAALQRFTLYESRLNRNIRNNTTELRKLQATRPAEVATTGTVTPDTPETEAPETESDNPDAPNGFGFSDFPYASIPAMIEAEMKALGATRLHDTSEYDRPRTKKAA